jgi:hypothetical protein
VKSKQPAQSTVESWRTVFNTLTRDFPDRSASAITPDEAQQWLDKLITEERSAFTVRNTWLRATRTVFAWGARRKLTSNPFEAAVVDVPRRKQLRPKWLYEHERVTILIEISIRHNSQGERKRVGRSQPQRRRSSSLKQRSQSQMPVTNCAGCGSQWDSAQTALRLAPSRRTGSVSMTGRQCLGVGRGLLTRGLQWRTGRRYAEPVRGCASGTGGGANLVTRSES